MERRERKEKKEWNWQKKKQTNEMAPCIVYQNHTPWFYRCQLRTTRMPRAVFCTDYLWSEISNYCTADRFVIANNDRWTIHDGRLSESSLPISRNNLIANLATASFLITQFSFILWCMFDWDLFLKTWNLLQFRGLVEFGSIERLQSNIEPNPFA